MLFFFKFHLFTYKFHDFFFNSCVILCECTTFSLFVLSYSGLFVIDLFYYYSLDACLFSNERPNRGRPGC